MDATLRIKQTMRQALGEFTISAVVIT